MADNSWNPWKMTAIAMALMIVTAVVTGLVVANWTGQKADQKAVGKVDGAAKPSRAVAARPAGTRPTQAAIDECNRYATAQVGQRDKTVDTLKDAAVGAVVGAAVGAAGGAIADGGKGAGKGAAIGGIVGAGGGTLYGLNENRQHDERYRTAYASCMRSRGYSSS